MLPRPRLQTQPKTLPRLPTPQKTPRSNLFSRKENRHCPTGIAGFFMVFFAAGAG